MREVWAPGSFTKNFSWGRDIGLRRLWEHIRIGFGGTLEDTPRELYRERVAAAGRPDFIPLNFFLFNDRRRDGDFIILDELVFQALSYDHGPSFDHIAITAFNLSYAGVWKGAKLYQRYPALWAKHYVAERLASDLSWDTSKISADDIQDFIVGDSRYEAKTSRKLATNLNYLYEIADLRGVAERRIQRWWVDALFLSLDRAVADKFQDGRPATLAAKPSDLQSSKFLEIAGPTTHEKSFAVAHLLSLYNICGGRDRFSPDAVRDTTAVEIPDYYWQNPNDSRPQGALHPSNPRILKVIPRDCAELAKKAGFDIVLADDIENFSPSEHVDRSLKEAVASFQADGIVSKLSASELHKLTRGE